MHYQVSLGERGSVHVKTFDFKKDSNLKNRAHSNRHQIKYSCIKPWSSSQWCQCCKSPTLYTSKISAVHMHTHWVAFFSY